MSDNGVVIGERPLTVKEREVLEVFLAAGFPGADAIAREVDHLRVAGLCGCGCPTFYLRHPEKGAGIDVTAEAGVVGTNDTILLFTSESGHLDSIEYVCVGDESPTEWPPADQIEVADR